MSFTGTDYAITAIAVLGLVWVLYGIFKRVIIFSLILIATFVLMIGMGYFQTGKFSDGFFSQHSTIIRFVGQLVDSYQQTMTN